jgi:hypothetical protein
MIFLRVFVALVFYSLICRRLKRTVITAPIIFHCGGASYLIDAAVDERVGGHPRGFSSAS